MSAGDSLTEDEVRDFCKEHLAYFKVPRHVLFTEDFPTTVTGKVQKFMLRELAGEDHACGHDLSSRRAARIPASQAPWVVPG